MKILALSLLVVLGGIGLCDFAMFVGKETIARIERRRVRQRTELAQLARTRSELLPLRDEIVQWQTRTNERIAALEIRLREVTFHSRT